MKARNRSIIIFNLVAIVSSAILILYFVALDRRMGYRMSDPLPKRQGSHSIVAVGDIAQEGGKYSSVADLIVRLNPDKVLLLGDNAYNSGSISEFEKLYDPSWGVFKLKTAPSPGNHEYKTPMASGYYTYFGSVAGPEGRGYYSFDMDTWHIISLNSEVLDQSQYGWLMNDLDMTTKSCILAYWHKPLFSSGKEHGSNVEMKKFWDLLYARGADVVLNGHEHFYERFSKQDPEGKLDKNGIREFVVGTGGAELYGFKSVLSNSEARATGHHGVLQMILAENSYDSKFISTEDSDYTDQLLNISCN